MKPEEEEEKEEAAEETLSVLDEGDEPKVDCTDKLFVPHKRCDMVSDLTSVGSGT